MNTGSGSSEEITEKLIVKKREGVGYLILNQPEKHNAISYEMWLGIARVIGDFETDDDIRGIVVSGEGGAAFSSGADISQFERQRQSAENIQVYDGAAARAQDILTKVPKPTIAKIAGYCIGGGLATALCCDLRFASDNSKFGIPAAKLGLGYGYGGLNALVQLIGPSRAKEIMFTARQFDATEAYEMGLVNRVLKIDELDGFVNEYMEVITGNAPLTIKACKRIIDEIGKDPEEREIVLCQRLVEGCFASEDYKEGRRAFMEKRKPRFRGR
ncbi:MAG: enoyl-CoA hydratase [Candidatus Poribacteria bacterium]|nr:enoyl-CoA hydratase [Candidatus Poribacteria bacterium]